MSETREAGTVSETREAGTVSETREAGTAPERPYPHPLNAGRTANMKANRRADTKPELALRRALHALGYRYRKDYRLDLADGARVRPDIVFTARKVAVFVDGCFWHCCPEHGSQPANNAWYWEPKLRRNVERDRAADAALGAGGWTVVRLWEHESLNGAVELVITVLASRASGTVPASRASGTVPASRASGTTLGRVGADSAENAG